MYYSKYKSLLYFQEKYLFLICYMLFLFSCSIYFFTDFKNLYPKVEIIDLTFEFILISLSLYIFSIAILYKKDYTFIMSSSNDPFKKKFMSEKNIELLKTELEIFSFHNYYPLFFLFLYILIGEFNSISNKITGSDELYFIGLLIFFLIIKGYISNKCHFEVISNKDLIIYKTGNSPIEIYLNEIEEHLKIFNETSQFRLRVSNSLNLIKEIYLININSLSRLAKMTTLYTAIEKKNSLIEEELRKILLSIINYNNERNEEILKSIEKNLEIINSLRN